MLDLYKLEIFTHVVEEGSFSGAAQRLLMTQSGVSQHIHDLEAGLGIQLFERGRRGVTLTSAGKTLFAYSERILALVTEAESAIIKVEDLASGQLSIGATPGLSAYLLPDWIQEFRNRYPRLTVSVQTSITAQIINDVLARRLDLGFIEGELEETPLARLRHLELDNVVQFVVVGKKHPWWKLQEVAITQLDGQPIVVRQPHSQSRIWLEAELRRCNVRPVIGAEFDNPESIKRAVINSAMSAILPAYVLEQEVQLGLLRVLPIRNSPLQRTVKLVWTQDRPFTPVTRAFLTYLTTKFPQLATISPSIPPSSPA